ncbi:MAG TPA: PAS domain S-box protein [Abditibacterium sp.]|jgi:PAS domain S-box-containing protein
MPTPPLTSPKGSNVPDKSQVVSQWISGLQERVAGAQSNEELSAALEELQTSYEELRVAEENLIEQNELLERAQSSLEEERQRYHELFDLAPDGYIITDKYGVILEANRAVSGMLGLQPRFLLGKPLVTFVPVLLRTAFRAIITRVEQEKRCEWEAQLQPRRASNVPVHITVASGGSGASSDTLRWMLRDMSESQRSALALHEANQLLSGLINASPVAIKVINRNGQITLWNPAAQKMFGWSADEMIGRDEVAIVPEPAKAQFEQHRREALRGVSHQGVEVLRQHSDGTIFEAALWTAPLFNTQNEITGTMVLCTNISERKEAEAARQELLARLVKAQEEERARISRELHDNLGQHLTAIMLGLDALQASSVPLPHGDRRNSSTQTSKLRTSIEGLANAAHRLAWELRPAELDDMGLEVALSHYARDWAERTGLQIEFQSRGFVGRRLDAAVETALYRVVQEALTNVARHSHAQKASVVLDFRAGQGDGQAIAIVEDDGVGFDLEAMQNNAQRRLGLLGMQERMAQVGGNMEIESEVGKGTSIFVRVPK